MGITTQRGNPQMVLGCNRHINGILTFDPNFLEHPSRDPGLPQNWSGTEGPRFSEVMTDTLIMTIDS